MSVTGTLVLTPRSGIEMTDFFAAAKGAKEKLSALPGVESVVVSVVTVGGAGTNKFTFSTTTADWETYGKLQQEIYTNPELIGIQLAAGKLASWEAFLSQEIDFDLLPS